MIWASASRAEKVVSVRKFLTRICKAAPSTVSATSNMAATVEKLRVKEDFMAYAPHANAPRLLPRSCLFLKGSMPHLIAAAAFSYPLGLAYIIA